ncbi:phospholipase d/transphosphatidylase [Niveomyces insectorum RCEF 264]|uniref:Phospholipase d/transphosphatidylase n=1 Tax=Niveomyces insectorum RCEF 264 TaxID=1081102 RepID=A0A162KBK6_9HYPO|nr:phospholipase d/transphosphatidylase [Niveomyces insectorum RCEF 264]
MEQSDQQHAFTRELVAQLQRASEAASSAEPELPAYDYRDTEAAVAALATDSVPRSFRLGTGASVFAAALLPAILAARREIVFVTCFWAPSASLRGLAAALAQLAAQRQEEPRRRQQQQQQQQQPERPRRHPPQQQQQQNVLDDILRIRIGLSSRTFLQKLCHTTAHSGYTYPPAAWETELGLPPADVLRAAGIDLRVKSLFFRPFGIVHPKFLIVDRARAFLPSCNVSWEPWLEGCVELTGAAVAGPLLGFYARTWGDALPALPTLPVLPPPAGFADGGTDITFSSLDGDGPGSIAVRFPADAPPIPTVLLPSSHHRNPQFRPWPCQAPAPPPPTPLNLALLQLFASARRSIYVQTPNLTAAPVVAALMGALGRGVAVTVVVSRRLMVAEQLVTAGTTTGCSLRHFVQQYESLRMEVAAAAAAENRRVGPLRIAYYQPLRRGGGGGDEVAADEEQAILPRQPGQRAMTSRNDNDGCDEEPVKSHLKLTIVDGEHTVLGSGNMDRASWYTSQELGVLFHDAGFAHHVQTAVNRVLDGRLDEVYPPQSSA